MAGIRRLLLLALSDEAPTASALPPLVTIDGSIGIVSQALGPYLEAGAEIVSTRDLSELPPTLVEGLTVAYLVGHGWVEEGHYVCGIEDKGRARSIRGAELVRRLGEGVSATSGALVAWFKETPGGRLNEKVVTTNGP